MEPDKVLSGKKNGIAILTVGIVHEKDVVTTRQRAKQLARLLGFDTQDQIRLATATSEVTRNIIQYAGQGRVEFSVQLDSSPQLFVVQARDSGPGIPHLQAILHGSYESPTGLGIGLTGARRLMDHFHIESAPGEGTLVVFAKKLPSNRITLGDVSRISEELARDTSKDPLEEMRQQNHEALVALELMRRNEVELHRRQEELNHLNQELEATNRGVVALYAELDERAEALRAASEIKSRFLSHMSHEFRTPLNSILALTSLLARRIDGDLTPEQEKQVGYIRRSAQDLFEMVNDLLDLAKVESGRYDVKTDDVEISAFFTVLRGLFRPLSTVDAVTLVFEDVPESMRIRTDEGKLAQIIRNLVANALKFTEQGEVRVAVEAVGDEVEFRVSDTGIGIARPDQKRIFEEFSQIDNPIQRKVRGTGLGLPLSRKLANILGGELTVASEVGVGSTFTLRLPSGMPDVRSADSTKETESEQLPTVLIIDDEEMDRYIVRQLFRDKKYRIIEATDGSQGAEKARFERPFLIILDLTMPGLSGFEVLDELKSDPATHAIPVIIHTSRFLQQEDLDRLNGRYIAVLAKGDPAQEQNLNEILLRL